MPDLSVSLLDLLVPAAPGQNPSALGAPKDSFQSLLDIGSDDSFGIGKEPSRREEDDHRDDKKQPLVAAVNVPTDLFVDNKSKKNGDTKVTEAVEPNEVAADAAPVQPLKERENNTKPETKEAVDASDKAIPQAPVEPKAQAGEKVEAEPVVSEKFQVEFNRLQKVFFELLQALTGNSTSVASDDSISTMIEKLQAELAKTNADGKPIFDPKTQQSIQALLKDMQQLMGQLQNVMQAMNNPTALKDSFVDQKNVAIKLLEAFRADAVKLQTYLEPAVTKADPQTLLHHVMKYVDMLKNMLSPKPVKAVATDIVVDIKSLVADAKPLQQPAPVAGVDPFKAALVDSAAPAKEAVSAIPALPAAPATPTVDTAPANNVSQQSLAAAQIAADAGIGNHSKNFSGNADSNAGKGAPGAQPIMPLSAAQLEATRAANAPFARALSQVSQQANLPEQVTFHIKTAIADGSSKIRIQLDPADLGKLDIKLHVGADGKTNVVITADNKDTLAMLQRDARGLEQALADAGLKTDSNSLSFNLRGQGHGQADGQSERAQAAQNYQKQADEEEEVAMATISKSYVINLAEGLDIKI